MRLLRRAPTNWRMPVRWCRPCHAGAGVVALDGAMLDRPHLALAQRLLAEAAEK